MKRISRTKIIVFTFIVLMIALQWQHVRLGAILIQTQSIDNAMKLLDIQGIWLVNVVRNLMQNPLTVMGVVNALINSFSLASVLLFIVWVVSFYKTRIWRFFIVFMMTTLLLILLIVVCLFLALNSMSIASAFNTVHIGAWVFCIGSGCTIIALLVEGVLIGSDTIEVE